MGKIVRLYPKTAWCKVLITHMKGLVLVRGEARLRFDALNVSGYGSGSCVHGFQ